MYMFCFIQMQAYIACQTTLKQRSQNASISDTWATSPGQRDVISLQAYIGGSNVILMTSTLGQKILLHSVELIDPQRDAVNRDFSIMRRANQQRYRGRTQPASTYQHCVMISRGHFKNSVKKTVGANGPKFGRHMELCWRHPPNLIW